MPVATPSHKWCSTTTMSLDRIVVNALRVVFPGESLGHATGGSTYDCPMAEACTTEATGNVVYSIESEGRVNKEIGETLLSVDCLRNLNISHNFFKPKLTLN